ncbi:MAG: hypothetical protein Q9169_007616 [Polycauliona sp. 2 TL-2023]
MNLKRKLEKMVEAYSSIESEENEITSPCRNKKARLWEKWHTGQPTSTSPEHPSSLRRKLEEMETEYDKVEKEEADAVASSQERKVQLWQEVSGHTPKSGAPLHPATLKRELEDMTKCYDRVEKEEKDFIVRCHKQKEELWGQFYQGCFRLKPAEV